MKIPHKRLEVMSTIEKTMDYLMALPKRLERISRRLKTPETQYDFKWIAARNEVPLPIDVDVHRDVSAA